MIRLSESDVPRNTVPLWYFGGLLMRYPMLTGSTSAGYFPGYLNASARLTAGSTPLSPNDSTRAPVLASTA